MSNRAVMPTGVALFLLQLLVNSSLMGIVKGQTVQPSLTTIYYSKTCPQVFSIVDKVVVKAVQQNRGIAAGLLRMNFHDCFVRGCDASVLIDSIPPQVAEKDGIGNANSLRGFEVIDAVKSALEKACPGIVSCADIIALATRAAVFQIGGPSWLLPLGRRDGNTSNAGETVFNLPPPFALYPQLVNMFAAKGLNQQEMVILSGAHTIGFTHCNTIESRLYNSTGPGGVDPNLDSTYASQLKTICPFSNRKLTTALPMDPTLGNNTFDNMYYKNVLAHKGLFISDAALLSNATGASVVNHESFSDPYPFFSDFSKAMTRLTSISVLLAPEGNVRLNCRVFNPATPTPAPAPAPVPSPHSPVPAPAPVSSPQSPVPAPAPVSSPQSPVPAPAPVSSPQSPVPAPAPISNPQSPVPAPAPAPVSNPQSPVPASSPAPTPVSAPPASSPAPTPVSAPMGNAPAPNAPTPLSTPVPNAPAPVTLTPVSAPAVNAPAPVPPVPAPAPVSTAPAPAPVPVSPTPTHFRRRKHPHRFFPFGQ